MTEKRKVFKYRFEFADGARKEFEIALRSPSLELVPPRTGDLPAWTTLGFHQCEKCALSEKDCPQCPIAAGLVDIIEFFRESMSYTEADITLTTDVRDYHKHTSLQKGISSIVGLIMASSGCPHTAPLRPLVFVHLPFATMEETMYRVISTFLLGQYFIRAKGGKPDWELKTLAQYYEAVRLVNQGFSKRLRSINVQDASLNAVANLDCFAMNTHFSIEEGCMEEIEQLFAVYLKST
jgi:hypothetical protein